MIASYKGDGAPMPAARVSTGWTCVCRVVFVRMEWKSSFVWMEVLVRMDASTSAAFANCGVGVDSVGAFWRLKFADY